MLNQTYRTMMRQHPYGYALYQPESSLIVKPGAVGYITNEGRWTPLISKGGGNIDLSVPETLTKNGLTVFNEFYAAPSEEMTWGPKISNKARGFNVDFQADSSLLPAGIPADIGALFKFQTDESFGAILMTESPVIRQAVYGTRAYLAWCKENTPAIVRNWPDVEDNGLIIVTSIHTTTRADIRSWQDKNKEISIGFKASVVEIGELAPSSEWYKAIGDDGWITSKPSRGSNEQKVVFFGGLLWKFHKLSKYISVQSALSPVPFDTLRSKQESYASPNSFQTEYNGEKYNVSCEAIGDLLPDPPEEEEEDNPDMEY